MTHSKALGELLGRVVFHWLLLSSETLDNQAAGQPGSQAASGGLPVKVLGVVFWSPARRWERFWRAEPSGITLDESGAISTSLPNWPRLLSSRRTEIVPQRIV